MNRVSLPLWLLLTLTVALASISQLEAQVGNNNPTGVSGIFNGQIQTGCSYDPFTGNAIRSLTDVAVAGAVGQYPLALVRTANSRTPSATAVFGPSGGWNHNYNWILEDSPTSATANFHPSHYTVDFPDGRVETFRSVTWDSNYRVRPGGDTPPSWTSAGVRERFVPLNLNSMLAYVVLPDGGKVEFTAVQHSFQQNGNIYYYYRYRARAIIDPYGLRTSFDYETTPNGNRRLQRVTQPAGRYIQFFYPTPNGLRIGSVTASDGRTVQYNYTPISPGGTPYTALTSVVYYNNANWTARYTYQAPNVAPVSGLPLLSTADEPMYAGPMRRIAYEYKTGTNADGTAAVYGQIRSERYWDGVAGHEASGSVVSTLTVGAINPINPNIRKETRGDGKWRTFNYVSTGYLISNTDFNDASASQSRDIKYYINSVTDRNQNRTDFTPDPLTGNTTVTTFPLTQGDTPGQTQRPTIQYTYGWANCPDPNNRDADNPYYLYRVADEGGHATIFTRDPNKRITRIDYPDGGYETFTYNGFGQVLTHRMTTGGTESFTYDARGLKQTYRNPSNATGNPTARYYYDVFDRVSDITDVLGTSDRHPDHTTSFTYNLRGQVLTTTLPKDPVDSARHNITNTYNSNGDGTLLSVRNELNQTTSYTYDDYRRVKSVTTPARYTGDSANHTTNFYYYEAGLNDDYRHTDNQPRWVLLPSGKAVKTTYDNNHRKSEITVGYWSADAAKTSYGYDNVGNVTSVIVPLQQPGQAHQGGSTVTVYDERNRPSSIRVLSHTTTFTYDLAGRRRSITRPNGQTITYEVYDVMNRLKQQRVTQNPGPDAVTKYTYTPAGLLETMQDPRLVANNSIETYNYIYDNMGRKRWAVYPTDSFGVQRVEGFTYDTAGRLQTFRNRDGKTQTFAYDALSRMTNFSWDDLGTTPSVTFGYDVASRLTSINNANANISHEYFNDNLLKSETETASGGIARQVSYTYDADAKRDTLAWTGSGATFSYTYTGRNQLKDIKSGATVLATYGYDLDGNLTSRDLNNSTNSVYTYDGFDRVTWVVHSLNGTGRTFNYGYETDSDNRKWAKRLITPASPEGNKGEVFDYDLNDQVNVAKLNILNPHTTAPGNPTIIYDANGNRTSFAPYGTIDTYAINNNSLNQYSSRTRQNVTNNAAYDFNGNLDITPDDPANRSTYTFDAQNRLLTATKPGVGTKYFTYDGLNRQVSRKLGVNGTRTYSVWDGWDLVQGYQGGGSVTANYLHGATGLVKNLTTNRYYYQDGSGSTSHLADNTGQLLWWFRYDLQGTPIVYNSGDYQISGSGFDLHLFTGQQWYSDLGLYDLRNRFYSPDIGRFLQPDPIGFGGDATNLYRYCGNNPVTRSDPSGEKVYIAQKPVFLGPGNHAYLIIAPSDRTSFLGSGNLSRNGQLTLSGQPSGPLGTGYLNGTINSNINSPRNDMKVVQPPAGMSEAQFDNAVYNAAMSYPDNTYAYSMGGEYNSNGWVVEILIAAGVINGQGIVESLPGWQPGTGDRPGQAPFNHIKLDIRNFQGGGLGGFGGFGGGFGGSTLGNFGGFGSGVRITTGNEFQGLVGPGRVLTGQDSLDFTGGGGLGFPPLPWGPEGPVLKEE